MSTRSEKSSEKQAEMKTQTSQNEDASQPIDDVEVQNEQNNLFSNGHKPGSIYSKGVVDQQQQDQDDKDHSDYGQEVRRYEKKNYRRKPRRNKGQALTIISVLFIVALVILIPVLFVKISRNSRSSVSSVSTIDSSPSFASLAPAPTGISPPTAPAESNNPTVVPPPVPTSPTVLLDSSGSIIPTIYRAAWIGIGRVINERYKRIEVAILNGDGTHLAILFPNPTSKPAVIQVWEIVEGGGLSQKGSDIVAEGSSAIDDASTLDLSDDGLRLAISYKAGDIGYALVYRYALNDWFPLGSILLSGEVNDNFGETMDLSGDGNTLAISAIQHDSSKGKVHVYNYDGSSWILNNNSPKGTQNGQLLGLALSINQDGSLIAICSKDDPNSSTILENIQVYELDAEQNWVTFANTVLRSAPNPAFYSSSVSISNDGEVLAVSNGPTTSEESKTIVYALGFGPADKDWRVRGLSLYGDGVALSGDGANIVVSASEEKSTNAYKWRSEDWIKMGWDFPGMDQVESTAGVSMNQNGMRMMIFEHLALKPNNPNLGLRSRIRLFNYGD